MALLLGAALGTAAIIGKAILARGIDGDPGDILLFGAVVAGAWFGGLTAGLVAMAVTSALNVITLVLADDGLPIGLDAVTRFALYVIVSMALTLLIGSRRAARDQLADALDEVSALAAAVERRDERLELMLSASGTGFWEWDMETGALTWSEAIFRQHGLEPTTSAPSFDAYLSQLHPDDRDVFGAAIAAAIDGTRQFSQEFRIIWPDGSVHWTHGAARVIRDRDGRPVRMLGTGQDITERRRLEEQRDALIAEERKADRFRESFVDVISHELRTPITAILGMIHILTRPDRPPQAGDRAMLDDVRAESERLHRLVEDLLVLSRAERGRLVVDAEPLEVRRVLERVLASATDELPSIDIRLEPPPNLPVVAGESTYVEQIIHNLLGNAAKYTPAGTRVDVSARRQEGEVAIVVRDHGPGIPKSSMGRLFELYYRDPESARTIAGSGIGLFVCARLAEALGGRIWARRARGGGSEFGFTLRVIEPDDADNADHAPTHRRAAPSEGQADVVRQT
jgi:PAS domain S-box-containing protein